MYQDLTFQLIDGDDATRTQPIVIRLSTHLEVIVPDALRGEQAVVRIELFDGRLQAMIWDGRTVAADGEPLIIPLVSPALAVPTLAVTYG